MIHHSVNINPRAVVDNTCKIGEGTRIHQFASITRGTRLGQDCVVWPFANLDGSVFGDRCVIASGVVMGPGFAIGNDVFIGPNVTFCNDMWPEVGKEGFDAEKFTKEGRVTIRVGDGASIGANAVILPGVTIGAGALIAAGARVSRDVAPGVLYLTDGYTASLDAIDIRRERRMRLLP